MDPKAVKPRQPCRSSGSRRDEADKLLAFLDWISKVDTNGWPPKPILATAAGVGGQRAFRRTENLPVAGMFRLPHDQRHRRHVGTGPDHGRQQTGPGLAGIGHFKDPQKYVKNSAMPPGRGIR